MVGKVVCLLEMKLVNCFSELLVSAPPLGRCETRLFPHFHFS